MKVWVVAGYVCCEGSTEPNGVFSSLELAKKKVNILESEYGYYPDGYDIFEIEVDNFDIEPSPL